MDLGEQLKTFSKDSIRLVKRCTKPDAKGRLNRGYWKRGEEARQIEMIHRRSLSLIDDGQSIDGVQTWTCSFFCSSFTRLRRRAEFPSQRARCNTHVECVSFTRCDANRPQNV